MAIRIVALLVIVLAGACRGREIAPPPQPAAATSSAPASAQPADQTPLEMRLGWVTGSCLAAANKALAPGSPITVVSVDGKPSIVEGRVIGGTASDAACPPLLPDRRGPNEAKWSFYEVKLPSPVDLGIGVIGPVTAVQGGIDLTGDGAPETFTACATSEGASFRVWRGPAYQGTPLWSGYYYLGYDTEATCPS